MIGLQQNNLGVRYLLGVPVGTCTHCWTGAVVVEKAEAVCLCGSAELSWGFVLFWFLFGMFLGGKETALF